MNILEKAKELGNLIAESEEMLRFKEIEAKFESDKNAKIILNEYRMLQIQLVKAAKENKSSEMISDIKGKLILKQQQLDENETASSYVNAKDALDRLMGNINNVIAFAITGEEGCSPDKCGSCGGCGSM